ncbi:alpha/beta hydrolase [Streptomyces sp. SP18CS02]|uniref:alpha/beta hydrolase n=1 Tax=Streptomyces sp. SP18CS02 TaxID=3002531 RepID=UPI002E7A62F1|nr:alpha/beta hydrolase [Streptomyces sp. SP18CS02]MEE1753908.1 alpha/beta hydrolase [Streptomyces sp. SP18CS02]
MQRRAGVLIAAGALMASTIGAGPTAAGAADAGPTAPPKWAGCATKQYPRLQCATIEVPLDHGAPRGRRITLALSRVPHTAKSSQGPLIVNPGGPGASGRAMAAFVAASLPPKVAGQYDVIGFDPRGVGAGTPALDCLPGHFKPVRVDSLPADGARERANTARAESFAKACGDKYGDVLAHMDTVSTAKDLDAIRRALGASRINYFGYSYGTYLGVVYAKLFPHRVRRAVLDSVVDPEAVWYDANIAQDFAFDARHKAFLAWVAKHDASYRLGTDPAGVETRWYAMRAAVGKKPAGGKVGPAELEDTFLPGGYYNGFWPVLAEAFSAYVHEKDADPLVRAYESMAAHDASDDNGYSVYTAVQCRDAWWPRDWRTWRRDNTAVHAKAPFSTWNNAWYNAPCAFWPVESLTPRDVSNRALPPVLLFQATDDAATPYEGAVSVHRKLRGSRLVVERGGGNHGVTLGGNVCLDGYLTRYLETGEVPEGAGGGEADALCAAVPEPQPDRAAGVPATAANEADRGGKAQQTHKAQRGQTAMEPATGGAALHRVLGHGN